jgi:hypothetical protein
MSFVFRPGPSTAGAHAFCAAGLDVVATRKSDAIIARSPDAEGALQRRQVFCGRKFVSHRCIPFRAMVR